MPALVSGVHMRVAVRILGATAFMALAIGCGGSDAGEASDSGAVAPGTAAAERSLDEHRIVIDVRTPEEFGEGHVEDAELLNVQAPDFPERLDALDPDAEYVVYCRSGRRSATAAAQMTAAGLDVRDGGSLDDMVSAGWPRSG